MTYFGSTRVVDQASAHSLPRVFTVAGRLFRASTGVGPNEMFTNMRLERAARDLRDSRKNVTEISFDCGFSQPQHLATAFRRKFGLTPTEFRRSVAS